MLINMILGAIVILILIAYLCHQSLQKQKTWDEATQQWLTDEEVRDRIDRYNRRIANQ